MVAARGKMLSGAGGRYTPGMTGMDRFIDFGKTDFVGKAAALAERDGEKTGKVLATLEIEDGDADASGFEPAWKDGKLVGFITSGGFGYTLGKSIAMALLDREAAVEGATLSVHIVGKERSAKVLPTSPHDPSGQRIRS